MPSAVEPRLFVIAFFALLLFAPAHAADNNIGVLRIESLDAVVADIERIATLAGQEVERDQIVGLLQQASGLPDLSWLDGSRPLAVVFPMEGMALGAKGMVAAFPVKDQAAALQALAERFSGDAPEDGVYEFGSEEGPSVHVVAHEGYLAVGAGRDIVKRFDPDGALTIADMTPGNIALDIYLEPVAPMALMGLQFGRQAVEQEMKKQVEQSGEEPELDPETTMELVGIYFDLIRDMLNNASRLQLSFELGSENATLHKRLVPKPGSTLAGMVEAQEGGLPELARYVPSGDDVAAFAGQLSFTEPFIEAMKSYLQTYVTAMQGMKDTMQGSAGSEWIEVWLETAGKSAEKWTDCYRGDMAGTFGFEPEGGFRVSQLVGMRNAAACRELVTSMAEAMNELPDVGEGQKLMTLTENALVHGGVSAWRQEIDLGFMKEAIEDEEAGAVMSAWFGDKGMTSYWGLTEEYMLSVTGSDAEQQFKGLVDRVTAKKKKRKKMRGLTAESFEPVATGPGYFLTLDMAALFRKLAEIMPADDEEDAAKLEMLATMPEEAGHMVHGVRFGPDGLHAEMAVPLELVEFIGRIAAEGD